MNIRKEIEEDFKGKHIQDLKNNKMKRNNFLILILFSKMTNRERLISTKDEVQTSTSSEPGPHG